MLGISGFGEEYELDSGHFQKRLHALPLPVPQFFRFPDDADAQSAFSH